MSYAELHNHSWFSLLDSPVPPEQLVVAAEACGMTAVGLTDRDTLAGTAAFWKKCRDLDLHAVTGSEVTIVGLPLRILSRFRAASVVCVDVVPVEHNMLCVDSWRYRLAVEDGLCHSN